MIGEIPRALGIEPSRIPGGSMLWEDPAAKKHEEQFKKAAEAYEQYRQEVRPTTMQGMRQAVGMQQPALDLLQQIVGPTATFDIESILQDPAQLGGPQQKPARPKSKKQLKRGRK
jgi:hypothetical protein